MYVDLEKFKNVEFLSVSSLNRYINYKFDSDIHLQEVYLRGEISNFKISGRHAYFSLKDEYSVISAMIFNYSSLGIDFEMADGIIVQALGCVKIYEKRGTYAIVIGHIERDGMGLLYQQFLELKDKLLKEGLFDISLKKKLPEYPRNVAVITAPTGDAIHDIISTFNRRLPLAKLTIYPALVQGLDAPQDLVRALKEVYQNGEQDVLIIGRGGGSYEDLACFNDETLARTLFASPIPTISAIGHDVDYTICDFVSSFRAPTPTGAAMVLTKEKNDVINNINTSILRLTNKMKAIITTCERSYSQIIKSYGMSNFDLVINRYENAYNIMKQRLEKVSPEKYLISRSQEILSLNTRLENGYRNILVSKAFCLSTLVKKMRKELVIDPINQKKLLVKNYEDNMYLLMRNYLKSLEKNLSTLLDKAIILNPLNLMNKGYAIVYQNDKVISQVKNLDKNKSLTIRMNDGIVITDIKEIKKME